MAATTSGALKAKIESLGLSVTAYRDRPPAGQALPYVTIQEDIASVPDPIEDGALSTGVESVQIDVWQQLGLETYTLVPGLRRGLHGARLTSVGSQVVHAVLVRNVQRLVEEQDQQVRYMIDVDVVREL